MKLNMSKQIIPLKISLPGYLYIIHYKQGIHYTLYSVHCTVYTIHHGYSAIIGIDEARNIDKSSENILKTV